MQKSFAMAALLAASCGAHAASDADLAAIRAQIDDMKKTYEQRIAALEQRLNPGLPRSCRHGKSAGRSLPRPASGSIPGAAHPSGQYKSMRDVAERGRLCAPGDTIMGRVRLRVSTSAGFRTHRAALAANIHPTGAVGHSRRA
jgi:hypothetical protein